MRKEFERLIRSFAQAMRRAGKLLQRTAKVETENSEGTPLSGKRSSRARLRLGSLPAPRRA